MKNNNNNRSCASIVWGLALIVIGGGYIGNAAGWWRGFTVFFDGWWTLLIILPCLVELIDHGTRRPAALVGLIVGGLLLASKNINRVNVFQYIVPFLLVSTGIVLILRNRMFKFRRIINSGTGESRYIPIYNSILGSREMSCGSEAFAGASVFAAFGSISLDLSAAQIREDAVVDISACCAGAGVKLPPDVNVKITNSPVLGALTDHTKGRSIPGAPTVFVSCTCVFGGIELK